MVAFAAHGLFDAVHAAVLENSGGPLWWPAFCLAYDIGAAARLRVGVDAHPCHEASVSMPTGRVRRAVHTSSARSRVGGRGPRARGVASEIDRKGATAGRFSSVDANSD